MNESADVRKIMRAKLRRDGRNAQGFVIRIAEVSRKAWMIVITLAAGVFCTIVLSRANALRNEDRESIVALDAKYQAAVRNNDVATMDRLLADDFILVTGSGKTYTKFDLLEEARSGRVRYDHQEDFDQTVRVWGDTAVITARLWESGINGGKPFDYMAWFSDVYLRTPKGWQYTFAQSSLPISRQNSPARQ